MEIERMSNQTDLDGEVSGIPNQQEKRGTGEGSVLMRRDGSRTDTYLEIYRITAQLSAKLALPAVLLVVILAFRPTIDSLMGKTTEAEIAGAKFKFANQVAQAVDQAIKTDNPRAALQKIGESVSNYQKDAASDLLRTFLMPDGKNMNQTNVQVIRDWLNRKGLDTSVTFFLYAENYANKREEAVQELGLAKNIAK